MRLQCLAFATRCQLFDASCFYIEGHTMLSMAHCIPDSARIPPRFCAERERTATRTFLIQSAPALGAEC